MIKFLLEIAVLNAVWWTGNAAMVDHYVVHHKLRDRATIFVKSLIL